MRVNRYLNYFRELVKAGNFRQRVGFCACIGHRDKAKRVRFKRSSQGAAIAYIGAQRQETTPVGSELTYRFVFETNSKFVDILAKLFQPKSNVGVLLVYGNPVGSAAASVGLAGSS